MKIKEAIAKLINRENLSEREMVVAMDEIMSGSATHAQIGSFLTALRMKGETVEEIAGAAIVMRDKALKIQTPPNSVVVDTCGTGGDGSGTFNISTTAAFITAGAGLVVAKHGNRSVSSKSGSADVLAQLGVNIEAEQAMVEECLEKCGIGFLFAPMMHGAMKHAIGPRRELGVRTIFNLLGPLTNPAGARRQVVGVYSDALTEPIAKVLNNLGGVRSFVVHGRDGLDEVTLTTNTKISEAYSGGVKTWEFDPRKHGFQYCSPDDLKGGDAAENARITMAILSGKERGPKRDVAVINAAFAILSGETVKDLNEALKLAAKSLDDGAALDRLNRMKEIVGV
ncbi:MAG: anthranilate phosphoribosyltransferase [Nitrospinae bacterium]|nr:anthranilate phosphoribosyltransferase [Nitrospinota bacterium]